MLPEGWRESTVGKACRIKNNLRLPISENEREKMKGPFPYIGPTGILDYINEYRIDEEFVTIGEDGDHFLKYKEKEMTFYYNEKSNVNNHAHIVCNSENCLAKWFGLFFQHRDITSFITRQGAKRYKLTKDALERLPILLPPLAEQKKIAEILSTWDEAISVVDRQLENCRQQKKALMQKLLTGKKRLPGFSGEWRSCSLGELGKFYKGEGIAKDDVQSEGFPCVRYGEIYTRHFDYIRKFYSFISNYVAQKSFPLQSGDILFTCSGETPEEIGKTVAYVGDEIAYAGGDIIILRPKNEDSVFLGYYLNSDEIVSQKISFSQGKSVVHISAKSLQKIKCRLPRKDEQTAIAKIFISEDKQIELLEEKKVRLITEKQALMQQLLTGKKRVTV